MKRMFLVTVLLCAAASVAQAQAQDRRFAVWSGGSGPRLGVQITMLTDELRGHFGAQKDAGVLVGKIDPDGEAAAAGVRVGDVLVSIGGTSIDDASDVRHALSQKKEGETLPMVVVRDRKPVTLAVKVPKSEPLPGPSMRGFPSPEEFGFELPDREGMKLFKLDDLDKRLEAIEDRLKKLEAR